MALTRHKSRGVRAACVPPVCEVCREGLVTTLIADFIFACNPCAERISIVLSHGPEERALMGESFSSDRETEHFSSPQLRSRLRNITRSNA
jgi:hypothetical protein